MKKAKDKLSKLRQHNDIYQIKYRIDNCNLPYVGQTKRALEVRINEQNNQWKLGEYNLSVLSKHKLFDDHEFDWENINILDSEINWKKRDLYQKCYISKLIQLSINKQI